jgi:hypothetical protein|nr:MAG TPA: hypothetical protein [Caudoviricetes sp.]
MIYIEVPDMNDSISAITIDGEEYGIRFTYNEKFEYWSFGIYDDEDNPIVAMTRVVPNFPLLFLISDEKLPNGIFGCISDTEKVDRQAFIKHTAEFVYIPKTELEV